MPAWGRDLVGVHADRASGLCLRIFVSPSASGSDCLLEDSPEGSFVHVVATDAPDGAPRQDPSPQEARRLFESVYGESLSDAALRQQRAFMLLEFPYHQALATDLFVAKDLVEGGARGGERPSDGLPFDQGLSYQEVLTRLAESAMRQARSDPDSIPKLVPAARRRLAAVDPPAPAVDVDAEPETEDAPRSLGSLLRRRAEVDPEPRSRGSDGLPFDQGLTYQEVVAKLADAVQARSGVARSESAEPPGAEVIPLGAFVPAPARRRRRESTSELWAPAFAAATFVVVVFGMLVVVALRVPPNAEPVAAARPEAVAPVAAAGEVKPAEEPAVEPPAPEGREVGETKLVAVVERELAVRPGPTRETPAPTPSAAVVPVVAKRVAAPEEALARPAAVAVVSSNAVAAARLEAQPPLESATEPELPAVSARAPAVVAAPEVASGSSSAEPEELAPAESESAAIEESVIEDVDRVGPEVERRRRERKRLLQELQRFR